MKTMSKWAVVGLLLLGSRAWSQPASREFYKKSMSATFNAQMLVDTLGRRAADRIIEYLEGEGAGTAMAYTAVQQLPMTGHPQAVPVLARFLSEDSPVGSQWQLPIRQPAIDGLAQLDTPESRRALAAALGGPSNKVYASNIVKHCGRLRAKECAAAIVDYVKREKTYYDDQVINLAQCSPETAVALISENVKTRQGGHLYDWEVLALGVAGGKGIPFLIGKAEAMKSRRWSGEWGVNLAWALGRTQDREAVSLLREMVKSDQPLVVYQAAISLARHKDKGSLQWIRAAQGLAFKRDSYYQGDGSDSDWGYFRRERIRKDEFDLGLAYALAALGDRGAAGRLKQASDGKDPAVALLADSFLLRLDDHSAAGRIVSRIDRAARKGFSGLSTDLYWNESMADALNALIEHAPEAFPTRSIAAPWSTPWDAEATSRGPTYATSSASPARPCSPT
jgi:HEAT repeat protein